MTNCVRNIDQMTHCVRIIIQVTISVKSVSQGTTCVQGTVCTAAALWCVLLDLERLRLSLLFIGLVKCTERKCVIGRKYWMQGGGKLVA